MKVSFENRSGIAGRERNPPRYLDGYKNGGRRAEREVAKLEPPVLLCLGPGALN